MVNQRILDTLKKYIMIIPKDLGVKKAYLFGSFAKGQEKEESDIDIALILENMPDFFSTQKQLMKLRRKIDLRIEPHQSFCIRNRTNRNRNNRGKITTSHQSSRLPRQFDSNSSSLRNNPTNLKP